MRTILVALLATSSIFLATAAQGAPGLGDKVYGAKVEAGVTELEARYGRLTGGVLDGEDALKLELAHGFSPRFYGALVGQFERGASGSRRLSTIAFEGIYALGSIKPLGVDVALYGEYGLNRHGADALEAKLLLEKRAGEFDARLNLIAERPLVSGPPVEFGYAASADVEAIGEFRLGLAAFGELGTSDHITARSGLFAGPVVKTEIEHLGRGEFGVEAGYLFALGHARDTANGQLRLLVEYEVKF